MSVAKNQPKLPNIPEKWRLQLQGSESLKSLKCLPDLPRIYKLYFMYIVCTSEDEANRGSKHSPQTISTITFCLIL